MGVAEARACEPRHNFFAARCKQLLYQRQPLFAFAFVAGLPVEYRGTKCRWIKWIGYFVAEFRIGPGVFLPSAIADSLGEATLEIAKEREGRFRSPLLPHE